MSTFSIILWLLVTGFAIWFALGANPLGPFPYRWATFWAISLVLSVVESSMTVLPLITSRGLDLITIHFLIGVILSVLAMVGLWNRVKAGAVCLISVEVLSLFQAGRGSAVYHSPGFIGWSLVYLILIVVNILYFKKRWKYLGSGLLRPKLRTA